LCNCLKNPDLRGNIFQRSGPSKCNDSESLKLGGYLVVKIKKLLPKLHNQILLYKISSNFSFTSISASKRGPIVKYFTSTILRRFCEN
jgi:hypothetical protein